MIYSSIGMFFSFKPVLVQKYKGKGKLLEQYVVEEKGKLYYVNVLNSGEVELYERRGPKVIRKGESHIPAERIYITLSGRKIVLSIGRLSHGEKKEEVTITGVPKGILFTPSGGKFVVLGVTENKLFTAAIASRTPQAIKKDPGILSIESVKFPVGKVKDAYFYYDPYVQRGFLQILRRGVLEVYQILKKDIVILSLRLEAPKADKIVRSLDPNVVGFAEGDLVTLVDVERGRGVRGYLENGEKVEFEGDLLIIDRSS